MRFVPINNFKEKYAITENGTVISLHSHKIKKAYIGNHGYKVVDLWKHNRGHKLLVHRLLAETFIPNLNHYLYVNHLDGNKLNNELLNLEWCTMAENNNHAFVTGLMNEGIRKIRTFTWKQIQQIRNFILKTKVKQKIIAKKYGVSPSCICQIIKYRTYKRDGSNLCKDSIS